MLTALVPNAAFTFLRENAELAADDMRTDVQRDDRIRFDIKHNAEFCFDLCRINDTSVTSRKPVDLVGT